MAMLRQPRNPKFMRYLSPEDVTKYLNQYPNVVEEFLMASTTTEFLENVIEEKRQKIKEQSLQEETENQLLEEETTDTFDTRPPSCASLQYKLPVTAPNTPVPQRKEKPGFPYTDIGIEAMCQKIITYTKDDDICKSIYELCALISKALDADELLFFVAHTGESLVSFNPEEGDKLQLCSNLTETDPTTVPEYAAKHRTVINVPNVHLDERFPDGNGNGKYTECHALCVPIILDAGSVYCVIEFVRQLKKEPYNQFDTRMTTGIISWVMACVQKMKKNRLLKIQEALNSFLLESTKVMFDEMEDIDSLITNIMAFTKDLVSADRCSLFLVDEDRNELYADFFDEGEKNEEGMSKFTKKPQIRFSRDRGISGYVARTGEIVNIKDAYSDERFNTEIDKKTGYKTRNILCMPINGKTGVTGVVQLINSTKGNHFTAEDESAFRLFAIYCALALHYSRIYNMLVHSKFKYKVAMDVVHYHICCSEEEFSALIKDPILPDSQIPPTLYRFDFCCYDYDSILPQLFIRMVLHTFGKHEFELSKLCRFILTVRKNYRPIQYHNWQHGFHVAHQAWRIMESGGIKCTRLEKMAMLIGGVCHDVDHRGYNNEYFKKLQHPLAALYSTSVMEQHHYKQTITILHEEGHDIFSALTVAQHKEVVELIRKYIIATDLATFFPNQKFLTGLLDNNELDINNPVHRDGVFSLIMTSSDLCAICKPWETQKKTAQLIYDEFYMQGDEEKKRGLQPMPMMDRINKDDIPKMQVGFITFVCKPMYTTLHRILPNTKPLLDGCVTCLENWKAVQEKQAAAAAANAEAKDT